MKFAIDAIFIDQENCVVGLVKGLKPFGISPIFFKASDVIEISVGVIEQSKTQLGDVLEIKEN